MNRNKFTIIKKIFNVLHFKINNMHKNIDLVTNPIKSFWKLTIPIMCFVMFDGISALVDMMWVSSISSDAVVAMGVSAPILLLIYSIGDAIGEGSNSIISRYIGHDSYDESYNALIHGILISIIVSVAFIILAFFLNEVLKFMEVSESVELAKQYLFPLFLGASVLMLSDLFSNTLQSEGDSKSPTIIIIVSNLLNLALDPIFIFNLKLGVSGAAYATVISSVFSVCIFLFLYFSGRTKIPLSLRYFKFKMHIIYEILKVGIPNLCDDIVRCSVSVFVNALLFQQMGQVGVLLFSVSSKIEDLLKTPTEAFGNGLMSVSGHLYGAKKFERARDLYRYVLKVNLATSIIVSFAFFLMRDYVYQSFSVVNMETSIFWIAIFGAVILISRPFSAIPAKMVDGFGKSYYPLVLNTFKLGLKVAVLVLGKGVLPFGLCLLLALSIEEIVFAFVYYGFVKWLFNRVERQSDPVVC